MNRWERIRTLWSLPTYRSRLIFFVVLGVTIILAALLIQDQFWVDLLIQFAVVFIAVGLVSFVWDFLGGDPMELRIMNSFTQVDTKLDAIRSSVGVLSDIVDKNIGIERIWPTRRIWENDPVEGLVTWKDRICEARHVDIVSNTLWTRWFHDDAFRKKLFACLERGCAVRIIVYDPDSSVVRDRAKDERDPTKKLRSSDGKIVEISQMELEIYSTLEKIARAREKLSDGAKGNLQVRLTTNSFHLAQIIRADEKMLIAIYLTGKTGSPSPTMQLRGPNSAYYLTYLDQIETLWNRGRELTDTEFTQILEQALVE